MVEEFDIEVVDESVVGVVGEEFDVELVDIESVIGVTVFDTVVEFKKLFMKSK